MSTIYGFASDIYNEYVSASTKFDKLVLFSEASRSEYSINCKEAQLKSLKGLNTDEQYYSLIQEAEESFVERAKNTIKKFIDTVKQFIDKCKERIVKLITDLKTSKLIQKIKDAFSKHPEIKSEAIEYTETDGAIKVLDSGISKLNIKATKVGAVGASDGDEEEIRDVFEKTMQEVSIKVEVAVQMPLETAVKYLERLSSETEVDNEIGGLPNNDPLSTMVGKVDDAPDSETADTMVTAASCMSKAKKERFSLKTIKFTSILQGIRDCFAKIKAKFKGEDSASEETDDKKETTTEKIEDSASEETDDKKETTTEESVYDIPLFNPTFYYETFVGDSVSEDETVTESESLCMSEGLDLDAYFTEIYNSI